MLKLAQVGFRLGSSEQPPSGGCVLKLSPKHRTAICAPAAFGRLCVETTNLLRPFFYLEQPPSGGCVLKHLDNIAEWLKDAAAAFGRLCVETAGTASVDGKNGQPPSGGCVLKLPTGGIPEGYRRDTGGIPEQPPSGGCVLKQSKGFLCTAF